MGRLRLCGGRCRIVGFARDLPPRRAVQILQSGCLGARNAPAPSVAEDRALASEKRNLFPPARKIFGRGFPSRRTAVVTRLAPIAPRKDLLALDLPRRRTHGFPMGCAAS